MNNYVNFCGTFSRLIAAGLIVLLPGTVLSSSLPLLAQEAAGPAVQTANPSSDGVAGVAQPHKLTIVILDGEGALNNIRERDAREPIVEVEDENHRPVAGAAVLFVSSNSSGGAGATFNTLSSLQVTTGSDGIAHATGFHPNHVSGHFALNVTATVGAVTANVVINEVNFLGPLSTQTQTQAPSQGAQSTSRIAHLGHVVSTNQSVQWVLAAVIAASVVTTSVVATSGGTQGTVITPGTGAVGAPSVVKATGRH